MHVVLLVAALVLLGGLYLGLWRLARPIPRDPDDPLEEGEDDEFTT